MRNGCEEVCEFLYCTYWNLLEKCQVVKKTQAGVPGAVYLQRERHLQFSKSCSAHGQDETGAKRPRHDTAEGEAGLEKKKSGCFFFLFFVLTGSALRGARLWIRPRDRCLGPCISSRSVTCNSAKVVARTAMTRRGRFAHGTLQPRAKRGTEISLWAVVCQ